MKIIAILNEKRKWKSKKHEDWQTIGRDKRCGKENEKIKTELLKKSIALEKAEAQVKKLDYQHRNM